jgi:SPP1 gp7 family putative phage head morphogenesis protein
MPSIYDQSFWNEEEDALWEDLAEVIIGALLAGVESGAMLLPGNAQALVDFDLVNTQVIDYAKKYRYDLIKGITDTTRTQVQRLMSDWAGSGSPLSVLEAQLEPLFGETRASMIAATETTRIYAEGNSEAWESTGVVTSWQWMTAQDDVVCEICGGLDGEIFGIEDHDARPPAHVNCRCWEQPILDEEAFGRELDRILG